MEISNKPSEEEIRLSEIVENIDEKGFNFLKILNGTTLNEIGEVLGVNKHTYSCWQRGAKKPNKFSRKKIYNLADLLEHPFFNQYSNNGNLTKKCKDAVKLAEVVINIETEGLIHLMMVYEASVLKMGKILGINNQVYEKYIYGINGPSPIVRGKIYKNCGNMILKDPFFNQYSNNGNLTKECKDAVKLDKIARNINSKGISHLRMIYECTQEQMAKKLKINKRTYEQWEIENNIKIANRGKLYNRFSNALLEDSFFEQYSNKQLTKECEDAIKLDKIVTNIDSYALEHLRKNVYEITKTKMAEKLGVSRTTYSSYLNRKNKPNLITRGKIYNNCGDEILKDSFFDKYTKKKVFKDQYYKS